MKLSAADGDNFIFQVSRQEKYLLIEALQLYPLLNPDYHSVSRGAVPEKMAHAEKLLHEAMAEQKRSHKRKVDELLNDPEWLRATSWTLPRAKMEWLLQVLNDVRVGSWVILGEPDPEHGDKLEVNDENIRYAAAMEICGLFQMALVNALKQLE